jgi:hypothetical protein
MRKRNLSSGAATPWYPVKLPISYEISAPDTHHGSGWTLAISSGAVRFACDRDLPVGLAIRMAIKWPAKLGDGTSLSLSAIGKIQRSAVCEVEVVMIRHEFRTRCAEGPAGLMLVDSAVCLAD